MKFELNASMMCANYHNLEKEVRELEAAGIAKLATKPLDVHLMVEHPSDTIHLFTRCLRKGDTIYIHPEAEYHPAKAIQKIRDAGMIPGIAINPGTSVETVLEMLYIVDKVLVMSVNPGNAGQMFMPFV